MRLTFVVGTGRCGTQVLITDGTADSNVPVGTIKPSADALAAAGATGPGLRVLDGVDHLLHLPGVSASTQVMAPTAAAVRQDRPRPSRRCPPD